jgi:hypothetical protein
VCSWEVRRCDPPSNELSTEHQNNSLAKGVERNVNSCKFFETLLIGCIDSA